MHGVMAISSAAARRVASGFALLGLLMLAACSGGGSLRTAYDPARNIYPEPGPPGDPWKPYISAASTRFSVPQQWIRAVMHQESGGHEYRDGQPIMSSAGAMGLMQLMPATYAELQTEYGLGSDPFEPHDNIMAGTGYIQQMYQRYGAPGFLAAYNAGPQRLDDYLQRGRRLPNETEDYVAAIAPNLGTEIAMTGPLATYASRGGASVGTTGATDGSDGYGVYQGGGVVAPVELASYQVPVRRRRHAATATASCWHDPDAAFDPDAPGQTPPAPAPIPAAPLATAPLLQTTVAYAPAPSMLAPVAAAGCVRDPDAAFDAPCRSAPTAVRGGGGGSPTAPNSPQLSPAAPRRGRAAAPGTERGPATGNWSVQVGAFNSVEQARFATTMARQADYAVLAGSGSMVEPTTPFGHGVLYRARLGGLARSDAGSACSALREHDIPCMVIAPGG